MPRVTIDPRIRISRGGEIAFGPGKADLLTHIAETGSLRQAAVLMEMSYMRAWKLVQTMNASFRRPLVIAERGGAKGGGAQLTDFGREVLGLYRDMERSSLKAMKQPWARMQAMMTSSR